MKSKLITLLHIVGSAIRKKSPGAINGQFDLKFIEDARQVYLAIITKKALPTIKVSRAFDLESSYWIMKLNNLMTGGIVFVQYLTMVYNITPENINHC